VEEHREKQMETEPSLFYFQKHSFGLTELLPDSSHISQREERGKKNADLQSCFERKRNTLGMSDASMKGQNLAPLVADLTVTRTSSEIGKFNKTLALVCAILSFSKECIFLI